MTPLRPKAIEIRTFCPYTPVGAPDLAMDIVIKARLPKPATPFDSLILGMKLMPREVLSRDYAAWLGLIRTLDERERLVLRARHGLDGEPRQTLQAIAG